MRHKHFKREGGAFIPLPTPPQPEPTLKVGFINSRLFEFEAENWETYVPGVTASKLNVPLSVLTSRRKGQYDRHILSSMLLLNLILVKLVVLKLRQELGGWWFCDNSV